MREPKDTAAGASMSANNGIPDWRSTSARHPLMFDEGEDKRPRTVEGRTGTEDVEGEGRLGLMSVAGTERY